MRQVGFTTLLLAGLFSLPAAGFAYPYYSSYYGYPAQSYQRGGYAFYQPTYSVSYQPPYSYYYRYSGFGQQQQQQSGGYGNYPQYGYYGGSFPPGNPASSQGTPTGAYTQSRALYTYPSYGGRSIYGSGIREPVYGSWVGTRY